MLMATLTAALVLAAKKMDPRMYNKPEDVFRGICEGLTFLMVSYNGISEFNQLRMWVNNNYYTLSRKWLIREAKEIF